MLLAAFIVGFCWSTVASAQTFQDFDSDGTGTSYLLGNHIVPPAPPAPGAELHGGGPTVSGRFLRLAVETPVPSHNSISFSRSDTGAFDVIVVDFDFRMTSVDTRADGVGFALLKTSVYGASGVVVPQGPLFAAEEPNFVGSLGIGFDIYQNPPTPEDDGDVNNNHLSIHFDRVEKVEVDVSEHLDLASGHWVHARLILRPGGGFQDVTVILTPFGGRPVTVIDGFRVDGFTPYEARVHFAARSGGASADHDLDNVSARFLNLSQGVLSLGALVYSAVENAPTVTVEVTRTVNTAGTATVDYQTLDLTAAASLGDYVATSGTLTFLPGETSRFLTVSLVDDALTESAEEIFNVRLASPTGAVLGGPSTASVSIVDDETARELGDWDPPIDWPVVPIHLHLLPTGRVLFFEGAGEAGTEQAFTEIRVWDPATGTVTSPSLPGYDILCSGHSLLPDGTLLVAGGHIANSYGLADASIYDSVTNSWTRLAPMNAGRWYPTNTTLANGDVVVVSGDVTPTERNTLPQVWSLASWVWRSLEGARATPPTSDLYPRMFVAPNGHVFKAGPDQVTGFLDTAGAGSWTPGPLSRFGYRDYGTAVMYEGKVLLIGGGGGATTPNPPTNSVELIDLNSASPAWSEVSRMQFSRRHLNATLLPTGQVLVTGGTSSPGFNDGAGAVLAAELFDPPSGTWSTLAPMTVKRVYHSTALLLPDGRVIAAGGGQPSAGGDVDHKNAEVYSPPYLFKGPRPAVASAPSVAAYGQTIMLGTPDAGAIAKVTLIRLGSVTHAFDQNQRLVTLAFTQIPGRLNVTMPGSPNVAPPGHYMLFIVNTAGVPSLASIIAIRGFTDEPLAPGTAIKAAHVTEVRARINLLRRRHQLSAFPWTDSVLTAALTLVKAVHVTELRTALQQAYVATGRTPPFYTDPALGPGTMIRALHISELRAAVRALE